MARRFVLVSLGGLAVVCGCATLPLGSAKKSNAKPLSAAEEKAQQEKQESLSEVEDFLTRTQQYAQANAAKSPAPPPQSIREFLDTVDKAPEASAAPAPTAKPQLSPPTDQVVANAQVAVNSPPPKPQQAIPALQDISVKWSDPTIAETAKPQLENPSAANTALDARSNEDSLWDRLLSELSAEAVKKKDADSQWRLRLAQLAADRDADKPTATAATDGSTSGDAANVLPTFIETAKAVRNLARNPMMTADDAIAGVDKLRDTLTQRSDPNIRSVALCRKVTTFGAYDEMAKEDFLAGRTTQTIVYCEVENLRADRAGDGQFQTRLATRVEVLTPEGKSLWQRQEPEILDTCHQKRKDFFIAQRITLPPTLPAGDYVLKVSIEDKLSNRTGEATHSFTVVSPISVAKGG